MQNQIQVFEHAEFGKIEMLMINDKPYFPATECAKILGYKDPFDAISRHTKGSVKHRVLTQGGEQERNYIPEGDLYRLIIRSKLSAAERFEKWVFDEVLPSIRKHGAYVTDNTLYQFIDNPEAAVNFFTMLKNERANKEALESYIEQAAPKVRYYDIILQCTSLIPISVIAKDYGMTATAFNKLLNSFNIQYKIRGTWLLYKEHCGQGYTISKTYHIKGRTSAIHTYWTQKGRKFIYDALKFYGILPQVERKGENLCLT